MSRVCPECGEEYERIAQHYAWNEEHRPDLSGDQLDMVRFLLLDGASVDTEGSHNAIRYYSTELEYLKSVASRLGSVTSSIRLHETAAEQAERLRGQYPDMNIEERSLNDVYQLRTIPHPRLDAYEDGTDVTKLAPKALHWFIKAHGSYQGSAIFPTLYLDTRDTGVPAEHLRSLLHEKGIQTGRPAESDGGRFFVPTHHEEVIALPKVGIDQLKTEFGIKIEPAEDERNHVVG